MSKVSDFLKNEYKIISTLIYTTGVFGVVFEFANFNREYFWLGVKGVAFISAIFLFIEWTNYTRQENYKTISKELEIENRRLLNQATIDRRELEEYFLLWVHQIKTPITVSNLILQKSEFEDKNKLKEQMFYIEEYTNMAINYLKLMDRDADMDITSISLDSLIKSILKKYSMLFIEKHISLDYNHISANVISDTKWLSILIEQILANAIKYTESGTIQITFEEDSNTLKICDTGIGIRSEDLGKIFDRGYSGFNGRINEKSSGLGLYLVKTIANVINVKVNAQSTLNVGSVFSVRFPSN